MVRKGQSTVEYILLVTAVMLVVIFYVMRFGPSSGPSLTDGLNQIYTVGADGVVSSSSSFFSSLTNYSSKAPIFVNNSSSAN